MGNNPAAVDPDGGCTFCTEMGLFFKKLFTGGRIAGSAAAGNQIVVQGAGNGLNFGSVLKGVSAVTAINSTMIGYVGVQPEVNKQCPCSVNLNDQSRVIEGLLKNFRYVESGGEVKIDEILYYTGSEPKLMTGGNWLERNIGNPIGNYFNEMFGSLANQHKQGYGKLNGQSVFWQVWPEFEHWNNNIGYRIEPRIAPKGTNNGYIYELHLYSIHESPIITIGFNNSKLYDQAILFYTGN